MALNITSANFQELLQSGKPLVIDFWATWCGPCKRLGPIIEELAQQYEGQVNIGKCDVEEDEDLPMQFQVSSIPCIVFFDRQGQMVQRLVGLQPKSTLEQAIQKLL